MYIYGPGWGGGDLPSSHQGHGTAGAHPEADQRQPPSGAPGLHPFPRAHGHHGLSGESARRARTRGTAGASAPGQDLRRPGQGKEAEASCGTCRPTKGESPALQQPGRAASNRGAREAKERAAAEAAAAAAAAEEGGGAEAADTGNGQ